MNNYDLSSGYTACYINSTRDEAQQAINHLNAVGGLHVSYLAPPADLSLDSIRADTQLFLVDWELDRLQESGLKVDYKGSTFARRIRDKFEHVPIALTTNEMIPANRRRFFVEPYLFDAQILKHAMLNDPKYVVGECVSLITGHQTLEKAEKTWSGLMEVLGVIEQDEHPSDEEEKIGEAAPPLVKDNGGVTWLAPEIAKWIQEVLLAYPGILYDSLHAATYLGITVSEFLAPDVQTVFQEARYTGVLAPAEGRWWKGRLLSQAVDLMLQAGIMDSSVAPHFAPVFSQLHGRELQLSECVYSAKKPASRVCYVLKKPVRIEYSLGYLPDNRPLVMDEARVSFTAIQTSGEVFDEYFDASSRYFVDDIRKGREDEL
ncbi:MAG: hypothetical protein ACPGWR_15490 [Ardenticatenaceae bacterium]